MQYIWDGNVANSPRAKLKTNGFLQFVPIRTVLPPNNWKQDEFQRNVIILVKAFQKLMMSF